MHNSGNQRPINRRLAKKRSYALAAIWLRLARSLRRWESGKRWTEWANRFVGALAGVFVDWKAGRKEMVWDALFPRFDSVFRQVLKASGHPEDSIGQETIKCVFRLDNSVNADPESRCFPELMWRACDIPRNVPVELSTRLRRRFHLRALLDEMPASDERGALRYFVFGNDKERGERKLTGKGLRELYVGDRRDSVERGIEQFSEYLYKKRERVETLTTGVISPDMLATLDDATELIISSLRD